MLYRGETGLVQSADGTHVSVLFLTVEPCDTCGLKPVCAPGKQQKRMLTLPHSGEFHSGQKVQVVEHSNLELHLALIQFGLPMAAFLLGLFIGYILPVQELLPRELSAFLFACLGLGLSFFAARHLIQRIVDVIPEKYLKIIPCS